MRSNKQKDIMVPKSGFKRSRFNWSHDVNTTYNWGEIQPTQCKLVVPNSKTTMSKQDLIRLAPMVAPTFGRVKYKTFSQFVALSEVFPNIAALLAQEPVIKNGVKKVPTEVVSTKLGFLSQLCLLGAHATLYHTISLPNANAGIYECGHRTWNGSGWTLPAEWNTIKNGINNQLFSNKSDALNSALWQTPDVGNRMIMEPNIFYHGTQATDLTDFSAIYPNNTRQTFQIPLNAIDFDDFCPPAHDTPDVVYEGNAANYNNRLCEVTPENADFLLQFSAVITGEGGLTQTWYFMMAFEFSDFGKRLRKILQGCGYQIDMCSNEYVSILPILAQYKAYFDIFGLTLYKGWETTYASSLINFVEQNFVGKMDMANATDLAVIPTTNANQSNPLFMQFLLNEVFNEWYTEDTDFIAAHMQSLAVSPNADTAGFISVDANGMLKYGANVDGGVNEAVQVDGTVANQGESISNDVAIRGSHDFITQITHGEVDAELLKRIYKWTNRNSILGRQIAKILRAQGLGKYVDECKSSYIGSSDVMITISDVISTADTESLNGDTGKALGEYGGRGLQYDQSGTLVYENDEYGYVITLATVVPEAGYTQGIDPTLKVLDKMNFYQPDFDAIGMELSTKDMVVGSRYIGGIHTNVVAQGSFGFIPRYSKFKVTQNLTNGDFNRHGLRNTYLPYTLDKQLYIDDFDAKSVRYDSTNKRTSITVERSPIKGAMPVAGNSWRYPTKYGFLGDFNRIFLNIGKKDDNNISYSYNPEFLNDAIGFDDFNSDNFLGHSIYDVQCYAPMKPIEESYGLTEDEPNDVGVEFTSKA